MPLCIGKIDICKFSRVNLYSKCISKLNWLTLLCWLLPSTGFNLFILFYFFAILFSVSVSKSFEQRALNNVEQMMRDGIRWYWIEWWGLNTTVQTVRCAFYGEAWERMVKSSICLQYKIIDTEILIIIQLKWREIVMS